MTSPSLPLSTDLSPADLVAFVRLRSRAMAARLTARVLALSVMIVLALGTLTSIVTTTTPDWWLLYLSVLGTFDNFSGRMFNATLIVAGLLITAFAVRVRLDLLSLTVLRGGTRPSRLLTICMVSVGLNMSGVGLVPMNVISFLHDRLASGIMLSFLALLAVVVLRRRHGTPLLLWSTFGIAGGLTIAIALFLGGLLNLAALEIIGFALIFVWVGVFTACLERGMSHDRIRRADAAESAPVPVPEAAPSHIVSSTAAATWPVVCGSGPQWTSPIPALRGGTTTTWGGSIHLPSCAEECRARWEASAASPPTAEPVAA